MISYNLIRFFDILSVYMFQNWKFLKANERVELMVERE